MVNLFYPKDSFSIAGHVYNTTVTTGLSRWLNSKESTCNAGVARGTSAIPGLGRSLEEAWQPTPVFFPGESSWKGEPGGLQSMGSQRVKHS